jgi:hypothetical protein
MDVAATAGSTEWVREWLSSACGRVMGTVWFKHILSRDSQYYTFFMLINPFRPDCINITTSLGRDNEREPCALPVRATRRYEYLRLVQKDNIYHCHVVRLCYAVQLLSISYRMLYSVITKCKPQPQPPSIVSGLKISVCDCTTTSVKVHVIGYVEG